MGIEDSAKPEFGVNTLEAVEALLHGSLDTIAMGCNPISAPAQDMTVSNDLSWFGSAESSAAVPSHAGIPYVSRVVL
jgi:hypothetical protein